VKSTNPFTDESHNEWILALDLERVNGKKMQHPVRHDLLELIAGYRLEAAQKLGTREARRREISFLR
jgi:hypothetical protein